MNIEPRNEGFRSDRALVERVEPSANFIPRLTREGSGGEGADPRRLITLLWQWRWLFVGALMLALSVAVVLTYLATPKYMARALIEIDQPEAQIGASNEEQRFVVRDPQFLTTQLGLLESEALTDRVASTLGLINDPEFVGAGGTREDRITAASSRIRANLTVEPVDTSRLIEIRYSDTDPERTARVTNALVDNFMSMNLERRYDATASARKFLENRIATVKTALEKTERQLVDYARSRGIVLVGNEGGNEQSGTGSGTSSLDAASLVAMNQALSQATNDRLQAEQRYRQAQGLGTSAEVASNPAVQQLNGQLAALRAEYQQKLETFQPDFPEMRALQARIRTLERQTQQISSGQSGGVTNSLQRDYQAAAARERALQGRVNQLRGAVLDLRGRSVQYNILQREVDTNRTLYDGLLQRYKEIGVAGGIAQNTASVVNRAKAPRAPYSPNLMLNMLFAALLGFATALVLAFLLDYLDDTIKTPDDVRNKLRQNLLGSVPRLEKGEVFWTELNTVGTRVAEAYATVRANIQFSTTSGAPRTILVTSSQPGEGKSSTSFAIAQNLARLGLSVLIIDADMRKPSFKPTEGESGGLSSLLTGHAGLRGDVLGTEIEGLFLLPSGPIPPNPAELLSGERIERLMREVESMFDHVIVDAPPLLGLADAALLGSVCESTIFVCEANRTRRPQALASLERLRIGGAKVIGVILSKVKPQAGYGYGYGYGDYSYGQGAKETLRALPIATRQLK